MAVRRDVVVPIPTVRHITRERRKDGSRIVSYVLEAPYDRELGYTKPKRVTIGHVVPGSETEMYPTSGYRELFPDAWQQATGEEVPPPTKRVGMRVAFDAVLERTGVRDCLLEGFDAPVADAILDYAMGIVVHDDATHTVADGLADQISFSGKPHDAAYYSDLFAHGVSDEGMAAFKRAWAARCAGAGVEEAWIFFGGAGSEGEGVEIVASDDAASAAVASVALAEDGLPVTFDCHHGKLIDTDAIARISSLLGACGIGLRGVVLGHGAFDVEAARRLRGHGIPYALSVKGTPDGLREAIAANRKRVTRDVECLIRDTQLLAVQQEVHLFDGVEDPDCLTLLHDPVRASARIDELLKNMWEDMDAVAAALAAGETPSIPLRSRGFLSITDGEVVLDRGTLQTAMDEASVRAAVSSEDLPPVRVNGLLEASEDLTRTFAPLAGELEYDPERAGTDAAVHAKACCAFVVSVVLHELTVAARSLDVDVDEMVEELNLIEAARVNGTYVHARGESELQRSFLAALGVTDATVDGVVRAENDRLAGRVKQQRRRTASPKKEKLKSAPVERKRPGPKPGFKRGDTNMDGSPRKKPGPKPGFKRGEFNADGSKRKKPGPRKGSHNIRTTGRKA